MNPNLKIPYTIFVAILIGLALAVRIYANTPFLFDLGLNLWVWTMTIGFFFLGLYEIQKSGTFRSKRYKDLDEQKKKAWINFFLEMVFLVGLCAFMYFATFAS